MKAPMYPEADQSATARPMIRAIPAPPLFEVIDLIGSANVCAADAGPIEVTMSVIVDVVDFGSPKRPTIATSAISAGNSESSP